MYLDNKRKKVWLNEQKLDRQISSIFLYKISSTDRKKVYMNSI